MKRIVLSDLKRGIFFLIGPVFESGTYKESCRYVDLIFDEP